MNRPGNILNGKNLKNKTVVITGASSGVGLAAALAFAAQGATLILAARRMEALEEVVTACKELGASALAVKTDVTNAAEVHQLALAAIDYSGRIDVWINNAGVLAAGEFAATPMEIHEKVVQTNLMGYLYGAHAVLPYFKQQRSGILINNISVGGWMPVPYGAAYSASKFGLRGFSEALRGELTKWPDIYVCDVFPAFLDTPGIQHAGNYTGAELKPAPPVYDPKRVAAAMLSLVFKPRVSVTVGGVATLLRLSHFLTPALTVAITAKVMETYFSKADPAPLSSGNLFGWYNQTTDIHGGWDKKVNPSKKSLTAALLVGGLVTTGLLIWKKRRKS